MKFEVGDTVRLLHSGEEGVVVELMGKGLVKVEVEGMDFPVFEDQIEHPYFKRFTEERKAGKPKKKMEGEDIPKENVKPIAREESGMMLSLLPVYEADEAEVVTSLKLYLMNETKLAYEISCKEFLNQELSFEIKSEIQSFSRLYLKALSFDQLNDRPRLDFVITPLKKKKERMPILEKKLKLKTKQIIKKMAAVESGEKAMFSFLLFKKYPLIQEKDIEDWNFIQPKEEMGYRYKTHQTNSGLKSEPIYEIDLHAEKIIENFRNMDATDILMLQLSALRNAIDRAIAHQQLEIVVIHGIGKGVLKREVHAILKQIPEVKYFINRYHFRYGFGATEVFFEYD